MGSNKQAFNQAMQEAADLVWDKDWEGAITAYEEAVEEAPNDVDALAGLGMSFSHAGRPGDAAEAYLRATELSQDDPVLVQHLAEVLEAAGREAEASDAYLKSASLYSRQQAPQHALACWQAAARAEPSSIDAHIALLGHHQEEGELEAAVGECLQLADIYQEEGRHDYAVQICQHALQVAPRNLEAVAALESLRSRRMDVPRVDGPAVTNQKDEAEAVEEVRLPDSEILAYRPPAITSQGADEGSPVETTRHRALTELAESVFEDPEAPAALTGEISKQRVDALIAEAVEFQRRGHTKRAIQAYEKLVEAGVDHPAVHFSLGLLYQEGLRLDDAIAQLEHALPSPDYRLGAHFALGKCHRAEGRTDQAFDHVLEVLKLVDLAAAEHDHVDELLNLYEYLSDGHLIQGDKNQTRESMSALVAFLTEQGWENKVRAARQTLDALTGDGPVVTLAEALAVPNSKRLLESIAVSQRDLEGGMYYAAVEECHLALEIAPNYLPVHRQLAAICREKGRVEEAVKKLVVIGKTYRVRRGTPQAIGLIRQALNLAPMDTTIRTQLVEILVSEGLIQQAVRQCLILADSFQDLAQLEQARETYREALRLVPRLDQETDWTVRILHEIGDLAMRRVDWRQAVSIYRQIRDLAPADEGARLTLVDLHYRLGESELALRELDALLAVYADRGKGDRAIEVLEDVVENHADRIALRVRLAQAHLNAGHEEKALQHLDRLGELQLNAGQIEQARATIRAIIALQPEDVDDYRALLNQINEK